MHRSTNRHPILKRFPSTSVIAVLWLPLACLAIAIAPQIFLVAVSSVAAQTSQDRKAEADSIKETNIKQPWTRGSKRYYSTGRCKTVTAKLKP